jgi:hypothetical protein
MGCVIDSARKARANDKPSFPEVARKLRRKFDPESGRVSRTHDCYHLALQESRTAEYGDDRRGWIKHRKAWREIRFDRCDQAAAK